jgi:hypothetical protein
LNALYEILQEWGSFSEDGKSNALKKLVTSVPLPDYLSLIIAREATYLDLGPLPTSTKERDQFLNTSLQIYHLSLAKNILLWQKFNKLALQSISKMKEMDVGSSFEYVPTVAFAYIKRRLDEGS